MESSTPLKKSLARKSLLLNSSAIISPLRRKTAGHLSPVVLLERADDEAERSKRRSVVDIQRRLTNISSTSSPLTEINHLIDENQIKDHLRICTKLYTENKISAKNAWELHVIDIIRKITATNSDNILQAAGSSLDIGAKVYAFRVDDVHTRGLKMASSMSRTNENQANQEGNEENEIDALEDAQGKKKGAKRKKKPTKNKSTVDKEGKTLFASPKMLEPVLFSTKENIEISATENLFTYKLHVNPANQQFILLSAEKFWKTEDDLTLQGAEDTMEIELPDISKSTLCAPFKDFEIGDWDPAEEEKLLANGSVVHDVVLDEDGLPLPELDGSIPNIFENNEDAAAGAESASDEEHHEEFQAQIHGEIAHIVDAIPEDKRVETEYGYNSLIRTESGKVIDRIWAGPSHWKVKFIRRSAARYSGSTVQQVAKQTRKVKVHERINFDVDPESFGPLGKIVLKKTPPTVAFEKITLPVPEISLQNFHEKICQLLTKPGVFKPKINQKSQSSQEYEVPAYNYENPNDSQYCSQNNIDDDAHDDEPHTFEEEVAPAACQNFLHTNLVNEPDMVSTNYVPYALQAKKMDMKKLKSVVWKRLTHNSEENSTVHPMQFSQLYKEVPDYLNKDMRKELSCHLVFAALLHLCNENDLILTQSQSDGCRDFLIQKAQ